MLYVECTEILKDRVAMLSSHLIVIPDTKVGTSELISIKCIKEDIPGLYIAQNALPAQYNLILPTGYLQSFTYSC